MVKARFPFKNYRRRKGGKQQSIYRNLAINKNRNINQVNFLNIFGLQHVSTANTLNKRVSFRIKYKTQKIIDRDVCISSNKFKNKIKQNKSPIKQKIKEQHTVSPLEKNMNLSSIQDYPLDLSINKIGESQNDKGYISQNDKGNISYDKTENISSNNKDTSIDNDANHYYEDDYGDDDNDDEPKLVIDESYESSNENLDEIKDQEKVLDDEIIFLKSISKSEKQSGTLDLLKGDEDKKLREISVNNLEQNDKCRMGEFQNRNYKYGPERDLLTNYNRIIAHQFRQTLHEVAETSTNNSIRDNKCNIFRRVLLGGLFLTLESEKELSFEDRAKVMEDALYPDHNAVEYHEPCVWPDSTAHNPSDFPCKPSEGMKKNIFRKKES